MSLYREIEKLFPTLEALFKKRELLLFKQTAYSNLHLYHFGFGTWIRNELLTSGTSELSRLFVANEINHLDDMSALIIRMFHCYIVAENIRTPRKR